MKPRVSIWSFFVVVPLALHSLADHSADNFEVTVSSSGFSPDYLNPREGDVIEFKFSEGSDTLTQSTLDGPCTPSGAIDVHGPDVFTYDVGSNTEDMFFFNRHAQTCRDAIFTINVSQGRRSTFQDNAANAAPPSDGGQDITPPQAQGPYNAASPDSTVGNVNTSPTTPPGINSGADVTVPGAPAPTDIKIADNSNSISPPSSTQVSIVGAGAPPPSPGYSPTTAVPASGTLTATSSTPATTRPPSSSGSHHGKKQNIAAMVIGIILGVLAVLAILSTLAVVWLRKQREAILPTNAQGPPSATPWRLKFSGLFSTRRGLPSFSRVTHPWNNLRETEERSRISPFVPIPASIIAVGASSSSSRGGTSTSTRGTFSSSSAGEEGEEQIVTRTDSPTMGRRGSGSTLVADTRGPRRSLGSFASLFVEVSDHEAGTEGKVRRDRFVTGPASSGLEPAHGGHGEVPSNFV